MRGALDAKTAGKVYKLDKTSVDERWWSNSGDVSRPRQVSYMCYISSASLSHTAYTVDVERAHGPKNVFRLAKLARDTSQHQSMGVPGVRQCFLKVEVVRMKGCEFDLRGRELLLREGQTRVGGRELGPQPVLSTTSPIPASQSRPRTSSTTAPSTSSVRSAE
jgi:hypothetical protein